VTEQTPDRSEVEGSPEGYTKERPTPEEAGEPGHPGPTEAEPQLDGHDGHDAALGHGHDAEPPVGPIDRAAWGASLLGGLIGLGVALLFLVASAPK
jgi:hypothetical protein